MLVSQQALMMTSGAIPATIPGILGSSLKFWFQADLISGSTGDPQSTLTDSSGNGFTATNNGGGQRATLQVADQNSLNTIRFTQSNNQRYTLNNGCFSGSTAASIYAIYKVVSVANTNSLGNFGGTGTDAFPFSNGLYYEDFGSTVRRDAMAATASAAAAYRIISLGASSSNWAFYMDGGTGGSGGGTSAIFSTGTNTVTFGGSAYLLGSNAGLSGMLDGWIGEFIITNADQSTGDRQKVEGYLAHKWGLTGNLSASHPYKSSPP